MLILTNFDGCAITCLIPNTKGPGTSFEAAVCVETFDEISLTDFLTVLTFEVIQWNPFLFLCLDIWWRHEIWKCRIPEFDYISILVA